MDDKNLLKSYLSKNRKTLSKCSYDLIKILIKYTTMSFYDFLKIQNGAYVVVNGDDGIIRDLFMDCSTRKVDQSGYLKGLSTVQNYGGRTISVKRTKIPTYFTPLHSHTKYMADAYRMGQGIMVQCVPPSIESLVPICTRDKFDLLIGKSIDKRYLPNSTAFQFEHTNMTSGLNFAKHFRDATWYGLNAKISKWYLKERPHNFGIFGWDQHTDEDPLVIELEHKDFQLKKLTRSFSISSPYYSAKASSSSKKKLSPSAKASLSSKKKSSPILSASPEQIFFSQSPRLLSSKKKSSPILSASPDKFLSQSQSPKLSPAKLKTKFGSLRGSKLTK